MYVHVCVVCVCVYVLCVVYGVYMCSVWCICVVLYAWVWCTGVVCVLCVWLCMCCECINACAVHAGYV